MLTVACVLRSGGLYDLEWVDALERRALPHMREGWTFRALVDTHPWPGWWSKMGLFDPAMFSGLVLALDLDTDVVGPLAWAETYTGDMALLSDFYRPDRAQSGVMLFQAGPGTYAAELYQKWLDGPPKEWMRSYRGDGEWLHDNAHADRLQDVFPGRVLSHKVHEPSLVCWHGDPKRWPDGTIRNSDGKAA